MFYNLLEKIKDRPEMFIGKPSLTLLDTFLKGFSLGVYEMNNEYESDIKFYPDFHEYVYKQYNMELKTIDWVEVIISNSENDEIAFYKFYEILDNFYASNNLKNEKLYDDNTVITKHNLLGVATKERHYTNHGNPNRFSNPHDHNIYWRKDGTFYYSDAINYFGEIPQF